jgi:hypothetical protein
MTIAVGCNLADGVVFGVDSAVTISGQVQTPNGTQTGVLKVYNDAEKLFPIYDLPIMAATYGAASLQSRTIRSHVREFEASQNRDTIAGQPVETVARELWQFLATAYRQEFVARGVDILSKPIEQRPPLGILLGGFGPGEYLSEIWELSVQADSDQTGVVLKRARGTFGAVWKGTTEGVTRFHKGFSPQHLDRVLQVIFEHVGVTAPDAALEMKIRDVLRAAEYHIPFDGMPLQEGVDYVRFLLDIMIRQTRFVVGAPTCGGPVRIAVVQSHGLEWVRQGSFNISH